MTEKRHMHNRYIPRLEERADIQNRRVSMKITQYDWSVWLK